MFQSDFLLTVAQIWTMTMLNPIYVVVPYLETGAGDLFSLAWWQYRNSVL